MNDVSRRNFNRNLVFRMRESTYDFLAKESEKRERHKVWIVRKIFESIENNPELLPIFLGEDPDKWKKLLKILDD